MKKILTLFALLIAFAVNGFAQDDTWTVAGNAAIVNGDDWTVTNTDNDMTSTDGKNFTLVVTGCTLDYATEYQFKVVKNHTWDEAYPESNYVFKVPKKAVYTVTYKFNLDTKAISVTTVKTEDVAGAEDHSPYSIVGEFFGWDVDKDMTVSDDPNIYTFSYDGFEVEDAKLTYAFKLRTEHAWGGFEVPASGNNYYTFPMAGTYNLKFTANISEQTVTLVATTTAADPSTIPGNVFWSSETPRIMGNWSASNAVVLAATEFENVHAGDVLHIALEGIAINPTNSYSAQVSFRANTTNWPNVEDDVPVGKGDKAYASIVITGDILKMAKQYGLVIFGHDFATRLIKLETEVYPGSDNSIWLGNKTLTWSQANVHKAHFVNSNVQAGQFIKLTYVKTGGIQIHLLHSWGEGGSYGAPTITDGAAILEVTDEMIDNLKTKGLIVNADGIRLTQIELLNSTGYFVIYDDGNGWKANDEAMIPDEGTITSYTDVVTGAKYFAIAPDIALNAAGEVDLWPLVIRPVTEERNFAVGLKDYAAKTTTGTDYVWEVLGLKTATLSYTPGSTGETDYTITNCTAEIEITDAGWATYSNANPYKLAGEGLKVYTVTGVANNEVTLNQLADGAKIPAGTGVLLEGTGTVTVTPSDGSATIGTNWLVGSNDYTYDITGQFSDTEKYTAYVLKKLNDKVGFYKLASYSEDNVLDPHKAFLAVPTTSGAPQFIIIGGGDGTTGIGNVNVNLNDNTIYDLQGRRVENPTKGIYIVNGKKIVVK